MEVKIAQLTSDEAGRTTLETHLTGSFLLLREATRRMMTSGGSPVVYCSTVAARRGLMQHEAIVAAKTGVEVLTRAAAAAHGWYPIRVNGVGPRAAAVAGSPHDDAAEEPGAPAPAERVAIREQPRHIRDNCLRP